MNGAVNGIMEDPQTTSPGSPSTDNVVSKKVNDETADTETTVTSCNTNNGTKDSTHVENNQKKEKNNEQEVNSKPDIRDKNNVGPKSPDEQNNKEQSEPEPANKEKHSENKCPQENSGNKSSDKISCSNDETDQGTEDSQVSKSQTDEPENGNQSKNNKDSEADIKSKENFNQIISYLGMKQKTFSHDIEVSEDSEEMSSDEDSDSYERRPAETFSIDSDSDLDNHDNDTNDIVLVDDITPTKQNGKKYDSGSPEVHEIDSEDDNDDCIVTDDYISKMPFTANRAGMKQSSMYKRKSFMMYDYENGDDESDVEVISNDDDPLNTPAKKMKTNNNKNNKPSLVIVDTDTILAKKETTSKQQSEARSINTQMNASSLYQSIAARGTTVTAVKVPSSSSKGAALAPVATTAPVASATPAVTIAPPAAATPAPGTAPAAAPVPAAVSAPAPVPAPAPVSAPAPVPLLPSLTDDMFVVEAPSFIVPYVYEKPSVKPFREFVDILGKELEEQKTKEEQERKEKEKLEKERKMKEKQDRKERRERGEQMESEEEKSEEEKKKKSEEKKERRRRKKNPDDEDVSWDGESSSESDDDIPSDEAELVKEIDPDIEEITDVITDLSTYKSSGKTDNYFDCSLGKFFMNIGLNLVTEYVQADLLKQQTRKLKREKKKGQNTKATASSVASLEKNLELSKENNAPYAFKQLKCEFCSFKTESTLAMSHHLETPHMNNNLYKCNFCPFEIRAPHEILYHMEKVHMTTARLERAMSYQQCMNCPFEDNSKAKMLRHNASCAKKFKPDFNLCPPIDWEPPAKIPKLTRQRTMVGIQTPFSRQTDGRVRPPMNKSSTMANMSLMKNKNNRLLPFSPRPAAPPAAPRPVPRNTFNTPFTVPTLTSTQKTDPKPTQQPSLSITPIPRAAAPPLSLPPDGANKGSFVICEICDGYIKDLEQLRNHMQWIHKVKIHPKMIYNRPPLNCQKCQFRFFTDKGLERHLLGSHGLVTSSMQEAANKGKDAGRCPVCGRVYQWKLLFHVAKDHNLTLKPAHLSYKCTVCTATFGMYKQFENHVYSAHRVVAKRVTDAKSKPPSATKVNDEITITPQNAGATTSKSK